MSPVKVFLVDDSPTSRFVLRQLLEAQGGFEVVGEAGSGRRALARIPAARPDIVLMDVVMPGPDGIETTERLMATHPCPVLITSDLVDRDAEIGFRALAAGALDLARKPSASELRDPEAAAKLARKIRSLAAVPVVTRRRRGGEARPAAPPPGPVAAKRTSLVAFGASTGGPPALAEVLRRLGGSAPWPVVVVQHISAGFTAGLAEWLGKTTGLETTLAGNGCVPRPGVVYLAPDNVHLRVAGKHLELRPDAPVRGHRPSVDVLFSSIAESRWAGETIAVLLTGMGGDGARGLLQLREAGALTWTQDEATSVVDGMPGEARRLGAATADLPLGEIGARLAALGRGAEISARSAEKPAL